MTNGSQDWTEDRTNETRKYDLDERLLERRGVPVCRISSILKTIEMPTPNGIPHNYRPRKGHRERETGGTTSTSSAAGVAPGPPSVLRSREERRGGHHGAPAKRCVEQRGRCPGLGYTGPSGLTHCLFSHAPLYETVHDIGTFNDVWRKCHSRRYTHTYQLSFSTWYACRANRPRRSFWYCWSISLPNPW